MPMLKFFDIVKQAISLVSIMFIQKWSQDVQLDLFHHNIKFHLDHMKIVLENEAKRFCFVLTLWTPCKVRVSDSGTK